MLRSPLKCCGVGDERMADPSPWTFGWTQTMRQPMKALQLGVNYGMGCRLWRAGSIDIR